MICTENNWMSFPVLGLGGDVLEMSQLGGEVGLKWVYAQLHEGCRVKSPRIMSMKFSQERIQ
jgi:hypothetical protein